MKLDNPSRKVASINTCVIYNYAQHYRLPIFQLLNRELACDFYFGDKMIDVKKLDYKLLPGFKKEFKNIKLLSHMYWQKGTVSLITKNYDNYIILGEYYCLSTWALLILSKFTKKKIYLWTHGWYGNESKLKQFVKKIFFNLGDHIFLYGNYAKGIMIKQGYNEAKLDVIYNSLNYTEQLDIRNQLKCSAIYKNYFKNDLPVLLFIGRLTKEKKLHLLFEAHKKLSLENILTNLVIIGSGEEEAFLKNNFSSVGNRNCWFYGPSYNEREISELIFNATVCVSPGNVGLTAMHSMVYGTPVISHNDFTLQMPEFEAIIPGKTGDFFIHDDVSQLVQVIKKWIDPVVERQEVRKQCYKIIDEKFNPIYQVSVFKKVIGK